MVEYKKVLRHEEASAGLIAGALNKQVVFATDNQHKMARKNAAGTPDYWVPEGYNVTYGDITIGQYLYHDGDLDTYLRFTTDNFEISGGGTTYIYTESNRLKMPEEVQLGQTVFPYTGAQVGKVLGITESGIAGWIDPNSGGGSFTGAVGNEQIGFSYAGVALNLSNRAYTGTGSGVEYGQIVKTSTESVYAIDIAEADCPMSLGVAVQTIPFFTCGYVAIMGRAQVRFDADGAVAGHHFLISNLTEGTAQSVPMTDPIDYNRCLGKVMEDAGAGALAWCILK